MNFNKTEQSSWQRAKERTGRVMKNVITCYFYVFRALKTTKFCLCPRGNKAWSPRLMDALWFGCIPVVIADHYVLPLGYLVDWESIAVTVAEKQVRGERRRRRRRREEEKRERGREGEGGGGRVDGRKQGETGKRILLVFLLPVKVSDLKRILLSIPDQTVREMQLNIRKVRLGHSLVPRLQCWEYS